MASPPVFAEANKDVHAKVEVILVNGHGNNLACVYGDITARSADSTTEITLFHKIQDECVPVRLGEPIPLLPSADAVPVPLSSSLVVKVNLFVKEDGKDPEIANGSVEFPAQSSGSTTNSISGASGCIQVTVYWS